MVSPGLSPSCGVTMIWGFWLAERWLQEMPGEDPHVRQRLLIVQDIGLQSLNCPARILVKCRESGCPLTALGAYELEMAKIPGIGGGELAADTGRHT